MGRPAWKNVRVIRLAVLFVLALASAFIGRAALRDKSTESREVDEPEDLISDDDPGRLQKVREAGRRIAPLHRRKGEPKPGDWLDRNTELGQTFKEYRAGSPRPPTRRLTTLYLQPWGEFDANQTRLIDLTADLLGRFYGVPVRTLERVGTTGLPNYARPRHPERGDRQLFTPYVLDALQRSRPDDALAVLALTTADLTPGAGGRWVFGQASLADRVGVWSLHRQGDPLRDFTLCLRRTLKTAVHETGHMLGIRHCLAYECGMNGSNHRAEADARPLWFCPEDEKKIWWACRLDSENRYARLVEFAHVQGLGAEARFWEDSLAALKKDATSR